MFVDTSSAQNCNQRLKVLLKLHSVNYRIIVSDISPRNKQILLNGPYFKRESSIGFRDEPQNN